MEQFGEYFLLEKIASGGMADIYKAVKIGARGFRKYTAVKKILPHISEDKSIRDMFVKEAHVLSSINHPNIVQIHDLGEEKGQFFIVMDFIKGKDLKTLLQKHHPANQGMPIDLMFHIMLSIADGLEYAHNISDSFGKNLNIVHRDINPNNIFLSYSGEVKIIDFGVVKADTDDNKTKTGIIKGKISYLSPEQLEGKRVDNKTDIFALGLIFFEMFARKKMFAGKTEVETLRQLINLDIDERIEELNLDNKLTDILKKILSRDEDKRYQTASHFKIDLQKYISANGIVISAQPLRDCMQTLFADSIESEQKDQAHYDNLITTGVYQRTTNGGNGVTHQPVTAEKTQITDNEEPTRLTETGKDHADLIDDRIDNEEDATKYAGNMEDRTRYVPRDQENEPTEIDTDNDATKFVAQDEDDDKTKFAPQTTKDDDATRFAQKSDLTPDPKSNKQQHLPEPPSPFTIIKRPLVLIPLVISILLISSLSFLFFKEDEIQTPQKNISPQDSPSKTDNAKPVDLPLTVPDKQNVVNDTTSSSPFIKITPDKKKSAILKTKKTVTKPSIESEFDTNNTTENKQAIPIEQDKIQSQQPSSVNQEQKETKPVSKEPVPLNKIIKAEPTPKQETSKITQKPQEKIKQQQTIEKDPAQDQTKEASFIARNINLYTLLKVTGNPSGQSLYINGEKQGKIPITLALPPGFYDIECKLDGYRPYKAGIKMRRGKTVKMKCQLKPNTR